jgi:hypothetical protein
MARPQQVVFNQFNMRTIGNRGLPAAPQKREFKPRVLANHIA